MAHDWLLVQNQERKAINHSCGVRGGEGRGGRWVSGYCRALLGIAGKRPEISANTMSFCISSSEHFSPSDPTHPKPSLHKEKLGQWGVKNHAALKNKCNCWTRWKVRFSCLERMCWLLMSITLSGKFTLWAANLQC